MEHECVFCGATLDGTTPSCPNCGGRRVDDLPEESVGAVKPEGRSCLRCGVPLVEGGLSAGPIQLTGTIPLVRWFRGAVRKARFRADSQSAEGRSGLPIRALRCERCGALELVAEEARE